MKYLILLAAVMSAAPAAARDSAAPAGVAVPAAVPAPRADPSTTAKRLVEVLRAERSLDMLFSDLMPLAGGQAVSALEHNAQTREFVGDLIQRLPGGRDRLVQIFAEDFLGEMRARYPEVKSELAALYESRFTEEELNDMIRFFSSGTGAKYMEAQPQLQAHMRSVGEKIGARAGEAAAPKAIRRAQTEAGNVEEPDRSS